MNKQRGYNGLAKLKLSVQRKPRLPATLFVGDEVQVIGGKDKDKTGKIVAVARNLDRVVIEGVRIAKKHVKPQYSDTKGEIVTKPMPVHVTDVKLIDPVTRQPTNVEIKKRFDTVKQRWVRERFLESSKTFLPIPGWTQKWKDYTSSEFDTPEILAKQETWKPSLSETPFPAEVLNQLERLRRVGKEGAGI
ncbi:hypothetical protein HDU96_002057 [Phlyctochytrium bullatum]|nr:hypothetical protein HDU96_002057 [Phlyctochytrium bullatum]